MIDTIVLTLSKSDYNITHPEKFTPSAQWALAAFFSNRSLQSKQNPTKKELVKDLYKPKLTLYNRNNQLFSHAPFLRIELSLPKLFFGNNFTELQFKDFLPLTKKLQEILKEMGITTTLGALAQAPVSSIHYSKNIALTDGSTPYHYIQKIKEANIKFSLDTNQTDYRNEGHSYKWHCNTYEVAFYDKIKDLEKAKTSEKRAIEKENALQLALLEPLQRRKKFEILRMEVRLNTRKKIKHIFKKLSLRNDLSFKKLFKPALSKKILLFYLDEIESRRPILLDYKASGGALLADLILSNPTLSPKQILLFYGLKQALNLINARELRTMFARYSQRSWYRLIADTQKIQLPITQSPLDAIRKELITFKVLNTSHLKNNKRNP